MTSANSLQKNSENFPRNFKLFYLGKMTRLGVLTDAINRGGFVWYTSLTGTALAKQQVVKLIEEISEVIIAHREWEYQITTESRAQRRPDLLEELSDVMDVLTQMAEHIPYHVDPAASKYTENFTVLLETWQQDFSSFRVARNYHVFKPELGDYMSFTRNSINHFLRRNKIENHELTQAMILKNEAKGPLLHGRTEFIALPKDDEWVDYFGRKFPTVDPAMLNPAKAWSGRPLK